MFFIRPRSQAARRQRDTLMELSAGDEVLTGAGIFGTVLDVESDRVTLETAPGTRITVLRSTIARRITEPPADTPSWDEHDEDEAHGAYHEYEHDHADDEDDHDEQHEGHADDAEHDAGEDEDEHHDVTGTDASAVNGQVETPHDDAGHPDDAAHPDDAEDKNKT
jgi:preprotein translocase YajC subunit